MEKSKLQKQFKFFNINDIEIDIKINDFIQSKTSYFSIKSYKENLIKDIMKDKKINLKHKKKLAQIWQKIDDLFKHEDKEFFNDKHTFIFDKTIDTLSPQEMLVASNCIIKNSISASLEKGSFCHPIYGGTLVLINCSVIGSINDFVDVFLINTSVKGPINHNRCVTIINTTQNDVKIEKISESATIELFNSNIKDIENSGNVEVYDSWINSIESHGNILIEKSCILGPIKITGSGNITIKSSTIDGSIYAENKSHILIDNFCEGSFVREFKEQENVVENLVDLEKK